jgi:hypothetical protein
VKGELCDSFFEKLPERGSERFWDGI